MNEASTTSAPLTVKEASRKLNLSNGALIVLVKRGMLKSISPTSILISPEEIKGLVISHEEIAEIMSRKIQARTGHREIENGNGIAR